jgi:hypothetical protein
MEIFLYYDTSRQNLYEKKTNYGPRTNTLLVLVLLKYMQDILKRWMVV